MTRKLRIGTSSPLFIFLVAVWLLPRPCRAAAETAPQAQHVGQPAALEAGWAQYEAGLQSLGAFDLAKASESFSAASKLAPKNLDYSAAHALTLLLQQRFAEGRAELDRAQADAEAPPLAHAIRCFAAALNRDRAGFLHYARPNSDFEWHISRIGEDLTYTKKPMPIEEAVKQFPKIASEFAKLQDKNVGGDKALLARGLEHRSKKEYAAAVEDLAEYMGRNPNDWTVRWYYGAALTGACNYERARHELSLVLREHPALFEAYGQRAVAAARMGNLTRAREDLAIVRQLDPKAKAWLEFVEKILAECEAAMPSEAPAPLFDNLLTKARQGAPLDQLAPFAVKLARVSNAKRLVGDEVYQDKLRRLQWDAAANPKSATKQAALGQFLFDELEVRGEYVDPGRHFFNYRLQTKDMQNAEVEAARAAFQHALGVDSMFVPGLMGMAQIKDRENLFGDAEVYVSNAMAAQPDSPAVLQMMTRLMKIFAGQSMARALNAASTYSWTEPMGNGYERVWTRYGDAAAAGGFESSAQGLLRKASEYTRRALQTLKDTPESMDYLGTLALTQTNFEVMRKSYERAVQLAPDRIEFHYALANAYSSLGNYEKYLDEATTGRNLEQTSVGGHLLAAWQCILRADWKAASNFLVRAGNVDPGDSRILAYMGAVAEGQKNSKEAADCFRAALALEEAHDLSRGSRLGEGTPACLFDEVGRAAVLRIRLARMIEENDPGGALALYEKNLAAERGVTSPEMIALASHVEGPSRSSSEQHRLQNHPMVRPIIDAMLPEPARTSDQQKTPPNAAGILQTSRALAALALRNLGRNQEAAEYSQRVHGYESYNHPHGVGGAYIKVVGIWSPRFADQTANASGGGRNDDPYARRFGVPGTTENLPARRPAGNVKR